MSAQKTTPASSASVFGAVRHPNRKYLMAFLVVLLAILVLLAVVLIKNGGNTAIVSKPAHLMYVDTAKNQIAITDSAGKQSYALAYPKNSYPNFEAVTPQGRILVSLSISSTNEGFLFIKDGKSATLNDNTIKALRSAVILGSSHQIFLPDEETAVFVTCPDTCKLTSLNIQSGATTTLVDTGVKRNITVPAYPLGLSTDNKSVYVRIMGANKLSKDADGLYQIDLKSHKTLHETKLPQNINYTLSLSPDRNQLAYQAGGYGTAVSLHVINMKSGKDVSTKWSKKDAIDSMPSALIWSPDGQKVLFKTAQINLGPGISQGASATHLAYLDTVKNNITNLQSVSDQVHNQVAYAGWIDNSTIVYEVDASTQPYYFVGGTSQVSKQSISDKKVTELKTTGNLNHVIYW